MRGFLAAMSRSPQEVLDMAEKRTTYKLQDVGGIGEVKIADEVTALHPWEEILQTSW